MFTSFVRSLRAGLPGAGFFSRHALAAAFAAMLILPGCSHEKYTLPSEASPAAEGPVMTDEYVLQPWDEVEVKFLHNPELNETVTIRPDGRISLQMINEVTAAGLTPAQLDDLLTQKYGLLVSRPMIMVQVKAFTCGKVYVGGEVNAPQAIPLKGKLNALQAVFLAGGFTRDAKISRVVVVSRGPGGKPVSREINLKMALAGELDFEEYRLRPFDIVYVPHTTMAGMSRFMSQFYRLLPLPIGFGFVYEVHDASHDSK